MKTANRRMRRTARQLFRLCVVDGSLDDDRESGRSCRRVIADPTPGRCSVLSRSSSGWCGSIGARHRADVSSAAPLAAGCDARAIEAAAVAAHVRSGIVTSFAENPALHRRRAAQHGQRCLRRQRAGQL